MTLTRGDFPDDFVVGTATAAYQIEGGVHEGGRGVSIWDTFSRVPGAIADGSTGDIADDHFHRYLDDIHLMASLGVDAYRFSIAWPRIQGDGFGPANRAGLDFYRRIADATLAAGVTPYATLYHWDLPQALEDRGGWMNRDTADRFADYSGLIAEELGDVIGHWITLNEPWCSAFLGYASGIHAPGRREGSDSARAAHHLLLGHGRGVERIRAARPDARVGITLNLYSVLPASDSPQDRDAARRIDGLSNRLFLDPVLGRRYPADVLDDLGQADWFASNATASDLDQISTPIDFLGVNYYSRHTVRAGSATDEPSGYPGSEFVEMIDTGAPRTEMDWEIHPDGLGDVLRMVHGRQSELPVYVTENGAAFADVIEDDGSINDELRSQFIEQHLEACRDAIAEGLPLRGYFAWTLLDNFEWSWGFSRRFGLVHVDYETQQRTPKRSAHWLSTLLGGRLTKG